METKINEKIENIMINDDLNLDIHIIESLVPTTKKGTIILLLGGYLGIDKTDLLHPEKKENEKVEEKNASNPEKDNRIIVGSKGYKKNTLREISKDENKFITDLTEKLGWRIVIFENMQFFKPNGEKEETWIDKYIESIQYNDTFKDDKLFVVGFSSGAYIVGLHLKHISSENINKYDKILGYGIMSFPVELSNKDKKTDFSFENFKKPTLFLSGEESKDNEQKKPYVNGYRNTKDLFDIATTKPGIMHLYRTLPVGHSVFESPVNGEGQLKDAAKIINEWFSKLI